MTALHLSAYHGHGSVTKALVAAGADVSVRDHKGSVRPVRPVPYSILKYPLSFPPLAASSPTISTECTQHPLSTVVTVARGFRPSDNSSARPTAHLCAFRLTPQLVAKARHKSEQWNAAMSAESQASSSPVRSVPLLLLLSSLPCAAGIAVRRESQIPHSACNV